MSIYWDWIDAIESYGYPARTQTAGEYCLGSRNLYPKLGGSIRQMGGFLDEQAEDTSLQYEVGVSNAHLEAFNWLMHLADGSKSNFDIANLSGLPISVVNEAMKMFEENNLIAVNKTLQQ